jgi:hypothetical protein
MTDAQLAAIRRRAEAASPGPWRVVNGVLLTRTGEYVARVASVPQAGPTFRGYGADVRFLLTAREDVRHLLAEVERLRAKVAALQGPGPPAAPPRQHHP